MTRNDFVRKINISDVDDGNNFSGGIFRSEKGDPEDIVQVFSM